MCNSLTHAKEEVPKAFKHKNKKNKTHMHTHMHTHMSKEVSAETQESSLTLTPHISILREALITIKW